MKEDKNNTNKGMDKRWIYKIHLGLVEKAEKQISRFMDIYKIQMKTDNDKST